MRRSSASEPGGVGMLLAHWLTRKVVGDGDVLSQAPDLLRA